MQRKGWINKKVSGPKEYYEDHPFVTHGFHNVHELACGRPTYHSCSCGNWCSVDCGWCWQKKKPTYQLSLFGD